MRYRLRTLLIVLALGPLVLAAPSYAHDSIRFAFVAMALMSALLLVVVYLPSIIDP